MTLRNHPILDKRILLLLFLISGFTFAQTTVTLQDQCNCEVLSGTAVNAAGGTSPSGADTGDIYVNTTTGIIYYWDGNSWELTSTDDQNLQAFTFNPATNTLSLRIENGNTVTVNLAALANTGTDDQTALEVPYNNGTSGIGAINVQDAIDQISATASTLSTLTDNGDGTFTYTNEDGVATTFDSKIATVVDNTDGSYTITDDFGTSVTIDTTDTTTTLVDNGNGSFTYTSEDGTVTTFTETLSTLTDNGDGTFTYTNEDGTATIVSNTDDQFDDEVALRTPVDMDEGGVVSPTLETTVQEVIDAIAPITSKAARIFYPPSIAVDASVNGTAFTINLYQQYLNQYGMTLPSSAASTGAPAAIPTYNANQLYYYVTYYDPTVFANLSINASGVMTYDIIAQPMDYNSLINVVFVVK